ncbi:GntR family transcriptional regulator [Bosea sp. 2RAB26]|uniref:GntR family transcriptional regulator n=1 Tax=Bosea sp. 2RAB26 TaxID=3237476 RepID=UPI003F8F2096
MAEPTRLQQDLAERIIQLAREDGLAAGAWLNENNLAKRLNVSRTPVRAALSHLEGQGIVLRHPNKGVELVSALPLPADSAGSPDETDLALVRIARDRESGALGDDVSELELMRRYEMARPEIQRTLKRLAELEMVERKPGYGWRFLHESSDSSLRMERYRFRMLLEPMGFLEPGFRLDEHWAVEMLRRHRHTLTQPWRESSSVAFYEMNAAFHEGLAAASGNRFIHSAIRRENQMRRLSNYDWGSGTERVQVSCTEHIEILERLQAGDREIASVLMRRHLQRASELKRRVRQPPPTAG